MTDTTPDFAALFEVCSCGREESCNECAGFQLTPRTAAVLWARAEVLGDEAKMDIEEHGSDPVRDRDWSVFDLYPKITWNQDEDWRFRAALAYDFLAADLQAGDWPLPTCPAEEMALHMILRTAPDALADGRTGLEDAMLDSLPAHADDYDWEAMRDAFFQDEDILLLFSPALDGIDDPGSEPNLQFRIGDYRPQAWFDNFNNMPKREYDSRIDNGEEG